MSKPTELRPEGEATEERRTAERRSERVVASVMAALGRPDNFLRTTVRGVSADTFRVNVMTGADASVARIAHSFFVTADEDGNVTNSSPAFVKLY